MMTILTLLLTTYNLEVVTIISIDQVNQLVSMLTLHSIERGNIKYLI